MQKRRWLFPLARGIDLPTLEAAMQTAEQRGATLVMLSLIAPLGAQAASPFFLELTQKLFYGVTAIQRKAFHYQIEIEWYELVTTDLWGSLLTHMRALDCQSILLPRHATKGVHLPDAVLEPLLLRSPAPLIFVTIPKQAREAPFRVRFPAWLCSLQGQQIERQSERVPQKTTATGVDWQIKQRPG